MILKISKNYPKMTISDCYTNIKNNLVTTYVIFLDTKCLFNIIVYYLRDLHFSEQLLEFSSHHLLR